MSVAMESVPAVGARLMMRLAAALVLEPRLLLTTT